MQQRTQHLVIIGDARMMPELGDCSVHLIVTSPPYWSIKDYGHPGQIGCGQTYAEYLDSLREVFAECARVLCPGCRMAVNTGDQFLRASEHGRYRVQPIAADIICILRDLGLDYMGSIIWRKITTTRTTGGGCWMGSIYYPRNGHITYEHEYIILFRKPGKSPPAPSTQAREKSRLSKRQRSAWFRGVWDDIPPARQREHQAMFPVELPARLIRMYTFWGETVLDPFMGSGTTALAAAICGRNSIGYEINGSFAPIIQRRFEQFADSGQAQLRIIRREEDAADGAGAEGERAAAAGA